ncbi:MAG: hypothetical protein HOK97_01895, partial [Deltaproteobacteria bacterium]|nr:hypothetical protein [Deltaproteobacteria bacterium]
MVAAQKPEQNSLLHLELGIEQALLQARKANFRAYLRVHRTLVNTSFLDYLELVGNSGEQVMAWSDGRENRSFAAIGEEVGFPVHSVIRFAQAGAGCLEFSEQVIQLSLNPLEEVSPGVPVAVGGFSFAPRERSCDEVWQGWEDGHLWVPRLLLHRQDDQRGAVVTSVVYPGDSADEIRQRVLDGLGQLSELEASAQKRSQRDAFSK